MNQKQIEEWLDGECSPYCESCGACGESGCCEPSKCLYAKEYCQQLINENENLKSQIEDLRAKVEDLMGQHDSSWGSFRSV